nr:transposase (putative), gypsy type [Tanacetum cinerariifolium]
MLAANLYSAADVTSLNTHRTPIQKTRSPVLPSRAEPEILSGGRHMDLFNLINASNPTKVKTETHPRAAHEVPLLTVTASRVIGMEDVAVASESSGTPSTIEKSSLNFVNEDQPQIITKGVEQKIKSSKGTATEILTEDAATAEKKNLKTLLEAKVDMKKSAEAKNAELAKELDSLRAQFSVLQVSNKQLSDQVLNLEAQVTGKEKINVVFEEFKKYKDDKVEQQCAKMDARLDKLSVDFNEELYPHMLTAIAGRRWVIGRGLRLSIMKCVESSEIRRAFVDVVSAGLAKGMSEGLKYGIEHGKAGRDPADVEAYDLESNNKLVKALQDLKDLKYTMIDQLEKLKDAPMDLIMTSLYLESDTGEDAP